jgi:uncharacterized protein (TIGR03118 family)
MNNKKLSWITMKPVKKTLLLATVAGLAFGCHKSNVNEGDLKDFKVENLVANKGKYYPVTTDPTLINAFGIAWSPNGIAWVNSVGGHVSELYTAEGARVKAVNIPSSPTDTLGGFPCGIVASGGKGFNLPHGGPASFLFSGFEGILSGWNGGNNAQFLLHPSTASYTGLAIGSNGGHNFVYAADFGEKKIIVWDTAFKKVAMAFSDPTLPDSYSPYNIQAVGDLLFVMYGELSTSGQTKGHAVAGRGKGFVSVFKTDGSFVSRFASGGTLNVPWGVVMAPGNFLEDHDMNSEGGYDPKANNGNNNHGNHDPKDPVILVGNFGDGHINVFTQDGKFLGLLQAHKQPLTIEGLWALSFAPSGLNLDQRLYFTAGPNAENDGVFGYITKK